MYTINPILGELASIIFYYPLMFPNIGIIFQDFPEIWTGLIIPKTRALKVANVGENSIEKQLLKCTPCRAYINHASL